MEEIWEIGERFNEVRGREKICSSENYGIGKVRKCCEINLIYYVCKYDWIWFNIFCVFLC